MQEQIVFYLPNVHNKSLPAHLAGKIYVLSCEALLAHPKSAEQNKICQPFAESFCSHMPLPPREARAVLAEMMQTGGALSLQNMSSDLQNNRYNPINQNEMSDIKNFSQTGKVTDNNNVQTDEINLLRAKISLQKILLLAYQLEEDSLSIKNLQTAILGSQKKLQACLGEEEIEQTEDIFTANAQPDLPLLPWRMILEAALAFLPEVNTFYTEDKEMVQDLSHNYSLSELTNSEIALFTAKGLYTENMKKIQLAAQEILNVNKNTYPWRNKPVVIFFTPMHKD